MSERNEFSGVFRFFSLNRILSVHFHSTLSDKVSEENGGVHDEEAEDEDVVDESENAESHFRNDVERTQDVEEGEPGQQNDPDPEDQVDPVRGPDHGPKIQYKLDLTLT